MLHILILSGFFGFWEEKTPTDLSFLGSGGGDLLTITNVGLVDYWAGLNGLDGWVRSRFLLYTPCQIAKFMAPLGFSQNALSLKLLDPTKKKVLFFCPILQNPSRIVYQTFFFFLFLTDER